MLQFVPHDAVTSSHSGALIARLFPPGECQRLLPLKLRKEGGSGNLKKTPPAALWQFANFVSRDFDKSRHIGNMRARTQRKNFLNKGAAQKRCLPSSFSGCPKTLENVCVTLFLALLLDGGVPSKIKEMNYLRYSEMENQA